jgi:hypothetical protein
VQRAGHQSLTWKLDIRRRENQSYLEALRACSGVDLATPKYPASPLFTRGTRKGKGEARDKIRSSPIELQPHLEFAWWSSQVENLAEAWAVHSGVWYAEMGVVKGVESLQPVFQPHPFTELAQWKFLEKGKIGDIDSGSSNAR